MTSAFQFGKHSGTPINLVPTTYLLWSLAKLRDLDDDFREEIIGELSGRKLTLSQSAQLDLAAAASQHRRIFADMVTRLKKQQRADFDRLERLCEGNANPLDRWHLDILRSLFLGESKKEIETSLLATVWQQVGQLVDAAKKIGNETATPLSQILGRFGQNRTGAGEG